MRCTGMRCIWGVYEVYINALYWSRGPLFRVPFPKFSLHSCECALGCVLRAVWVRFECVLSAVRVFGWAFLGITTQFSWGLLGLVSWYCWGEAASCVRTDHDARKLLHWSLNWFIWWLNVSVYNFITHHIHHSSIHQFINLQDFRSKFWSQSHQNRINTINKVWSRKKDH